MSDELQNGQAPVSHAADDQQDAPEATPAPTEQTEETNDSDGQAAV